MQEETNPIKDYLFEYIENSKIIPKLAAEKKFDQIIEDVTKNCYDHILSMDKKDKAVGVLATGLLHYLLTSALISSQRKVQYNDNELDIVIPNTKTLEMDPKKTLLIVIPKSSEIKVIEEKISKLDEIQSVKENIWLVLSENIPTGRKTFVLSKDENSFSKIIFEIAQFSNVHGTSKFKILRI